MHGEEQLALRTGTRGPGDAVRDSENVVDGAEAGDLGGAHGRHGEFLRGWLRWNAAGGELGVQGGFMPEGGIPLRSRAYEIRGREGMA